MISPRRLGGWQCQSMAAEASAALEAVGVSCRMEPMSYRGGSDCFEMAVIGKRRVAEQEAAPSGLFRITIWDSTVTGVTDFSAVQDRGRRMIGALNQAAPVAVTPGTGGWRLKMVQLLPEEGALTLEPEEPFVLKVYEKGLVTSYQGCCWNTVRKIMDQTRSRLEWEGYALSKTEGFDG